eukprot:Blabericola_migrator_1__4889@NODE_2556_length_2615_cov_20_197017_g1597_i0_p1_GENE_NODE_2556_length_2615_cov_20_197017_g1597_i0NODE_2556_length_2615_cov_20_197017_g1597_i0_p1_ORF_typecomplete_len206_score25_16DUF4795/PF16043_5/0_052_NODE_2556_length_2615_cov_20_197017_g1597_i012101827
MSLQAPPSSLEQHGLRSCKPHGTGFVRARCPPLRQRWQSFVAGEKAVNPLSTNGCRIQDCQTEMLRRIRAASFQDLYNCSVLNEAQDALEREVYNLPSWVAKSLAHSLATPLRNLLSATFEAALTHLIKLHKVEFQKALDDANASTKDYLARLSALRDDLDTLKHTHLAAFTQSTAEMRIVQYPFGKRLLGLGLLPDEIGKAHLG